MPFDLAWLSPPHFESQIIDLTKQDDFPVLKTPGPFMGPVQILPDLVDGAGRESLIDSVYHSTLGLSNKEEKKI